MQEKYGFVYIWYDRKHKRYYIGSHWGHEDDGYICSSPWMKNAYKRRPHDFKRRIIKRVYTTRSELLDEEYVWLQKIPSYKVGTRYYNLTTHRNGHWTTNPPKHKIVKQKLSETMKAKHQDPEYQEIFKKGRTKTAEKLKEKCKDPAFIEKKSKIMKAVMAEKFPVENRPNQVAKYTPEGELTPAFKIRYKQGMEKYYNNRPEEDTLRRSEQAKQRKGFYKANKRKGMKNSEQHNLKIAQANGKAVVIDGVEYHSKCAAARAFGISDGTVNNRIKSDKWPSWRYKE